MRVRTSDAVTGTHDAVTGTEMCRASDVCPSIPAAAFSLIQSPRSDHVRITTTRFFNTTFSRRWSAPNNCKHVRSRVSKYYVLVIVERATVTSGPHATLSTTRWLEVCVSVRGKRLKNCRQKIWARSKRFTWPTKDPKRLFPEPASPRKSSYHDVFVLERDRRSTVMRTERTLRRVKCFYVVHARTVFFYLCTFISRVITLDTSTERGEETLDIVSRSRGS